MKIYIIGGKAKSGKNTFGELLRDNLKEYGYKPCVMQITEPLYSYARNYLVFLYLQIIYLVGNLFFLIYFL